MYSNTVDYGEDMEGGTIFFSQEEIQSDRTEEVPHEEGNNWKTSPPKPTQNHNLDDKRLTNESMKVMNTHFKKRCGMKARKERPELIVDKVITLDEIPYFLTQALVGRLYENVTSRASLQQWIVANWGGLLGYEPTFYTLP